MKVRYPALCGITMTVMDWIDVFTRKNHKLAIVDSLKYCQTQKGLEIFAWCLMPSHLHLITRAGDNNKLSAIIRDFKKYTSKEIVRLIQEEPESRREWMLDRFEFAGRYNPKIKNYKFWQDGSHPVELFSIPGIVLLVLIIFVLLLLAWCYKKVHYKYNHLYVLKSFFYSSWSGNYEPIGG